MHVVDDLLLGDDLDGVVLRDVHVALAVEDLLRLGRHEQRLTPLRQLAWAQRKQMCCQTCKEHAKHKTKSSRELSK